MRHLLVTIAGALSFAATARADDSALAKYRKGWNPFAAGPELVSSADVQPRGQLFLRPYIYSELAYGEFGGSWSFDRSPLSQRLFSIAPQVEFSVGILDWLEYEMYVPETSWWQLAGDGSPASDGHGFGDMTAFLKARFLVQQPHTWWPSLTETFFVTLPTSDWFGPVGTPPVPGGFAPLGRLPSTHFGAPELTEAIQYRLAFEQIVDEQHGFGWAVELVGIHGLPFRLDAQTVNAGKTSFGLIGVQPTLEYCFTDRIVGAAGVLFTTAGMNDVAAVYPNLSLYYYWNPRGKVLAR